MKVLFVCTANICRSAYAEVLARQLALDGLTYASAGVHGWDAAPMEPLMAAEAEARGANVDEFRSRQLVMEMVDEADVVLTAETLHRRLILEERPLAYRKAFTFGQFARGLAAVRDPHLHLLEEIRARAATSTATDDVVDPFGRGPAAAQAAARQLDGLLHQILPRLADAAELSDSSD
jgi:protein-tyrosine-phosphatase